MAQLGQSKAEFKKSGAALYAISNEDGAALKKMQEQHHLDFVMFLSDKTGAAAKKYAGTYPNQTMCEPGTFVIGKDKKIAFAYVNEDFRTRASTDAVLATLVKMKENP